MHWNASHSLQAVICILSNKVHEAYVIRKFYKEAVLGINFKAVGRYGEKNWGQYTTLGKISDFIIVSKGNLSNAFV